MIIKIIINHYQIKKNIINNNGNQNNNTIININFNNGDNIKNNKSNYNTIDFQSKNEKILSNYYLINNLEK